MTNEQLWQAVLGELELTLSKANFTTWLKNTFISLKENDKVVIGVPNTFTQAWLEKKYHPAILKAFQSVTSGQVKEIIYKVETFKLSYKNKLLESQKPATKTETLPEAKTSYREETGKINRYGLNTKYTFENFIVGKGNELAHAACQAAATKPGEVYNPLFVYGGVGLGKTHLLQAIGHKLLTVSPGIRILYVTCEKFTNEFIHAVRNGYGKEFKDTYRNVDLLLVDDIQFISGKEGTQEEFFHTFNSLYQNGKQIVISSDRQPKAIPALEDRLLSRFECGLIADITPPDLETRIAILETKCQEKDFKLSGDCLNYVANNIQNNIRELEGALNRIVAYHQLNKSEPTLETIKNILNVLTVGFRKGAITAKQLINTVASFYEIAIENIISSGRKKELVLPRQIIMYLMREEMGSSYPAIGQELGGRDHTTAMHACGKIAKVLVENEKIRQDINLIKQRLYAQTTC